MQVLLVEDAGLMRDGLAALLATEAGVEVIGMIANNAPAIGLIAVSPPDVTVVDFRPERGEQAVAALHSRWPRVRVLALTRPDEPAAVDQALRSGVHGYVLRNASRAEFMAALRDVAAGNRYIGPVRRRAARLTRGSAMRRDASEGLRRLTSREREVMQCVAAGLRTRDIAQRFSVSRKTVEKHRSNLMRKLGLHSATAVAVYAVTNGFGGTRAPLSGAT